MRRTWLRNMITVAWILGIGTGMTGCQAVSQPAGETPQAPAQEAEAKGRYVETERELPEELAHAWLKDIQVMKDGGVEILAEQYREGEASTYLHYRYDGTEWEKRDSQWLERLEKQPQIYMWEPCVGQDGRYYAGTVDEAGRYHLYQKTETGEVQEILEDVFLPSKEDGTAEWGMRPSGIEVNEKGEILLIEQELAHLYRQDGTLAFTMEQDPLQNSSQKGTWILRGEDYITFLDGDIVRYDLKNGEILERIVCEGGASREEGSGVLAIDDADGIYLAGRSGLSHINQGASLWEQMIDGNMTAMGMQDLYLAGWVLGEDGDFYGIFQGEFSDGIRLFHYSYDADIAAVPPVTLTVYSLKDVASVHQAATMMQRLNPDVRVEYRVAVEDGEESVQEDMIRSLNMELLNGKGADVLILDGLPADTYREKGILLDMRELFETIDRETPLLPAVLEDFTEADGGIYRMPIRLSFPAVMGEPDAIEVLGTLEGMGRYEGSLPLLPRNNYENILRLVANIRYEELWNEAGEMPDEATLIRYLEAVKAIGEQNGAKTEYSKAELEAAGQRYHSNYVEARGMANVPVPYDRNEAAAVVMEYPSVYSTTLSWAVVDKRPGREPQTVSDIYFPLSMVGINQASGQQEAAQEFVQLLYSEEVQKVEFFQSERDGFPVQIGALESWKDLERSVNIGTGSPEGYFLMGKWPERERREQLVAMVSSLSEPVVVDETVMGMIVDGAKGYLDGKETVQEAAAGIYRQISLYDAE